MAGTDLEAALPWIIALGGGTGIGMGLKALVDTIVAIRSGVSAREGKRTQQIVKQRDDALAAIADERRRANDEMARADWADRNMQILKSNEQRAREHAADLRIELMNRGGMRRDELPEWPDMEQTIPRAKLAERLAREREKEPE